MTKNKFLLMEHVWIGVAVITFVFFIYDTFKSGFSQSYIMLIFSAVSVLMYLWRKSLRKKEENEENQNND